MGLQRYLDDINSVNLTCQIGHGDVPAKGAIDLCLSQAACKTSWDDGPNLPITYCNKQ